MARSLRGPFAPWPEARRWRALRWSLGIGALWGAAMVRVAGPMRAGGHDIVAFEVAGDAATVEEIVAAWGPEGVRAARVQTWMDMGYLGLYAVAAGTGCALVADHARAAGRPGIATAGDLLGWGAVVAAGCDAVENAAMLAELGGARGRLPAVAQRCAQVKFALIGPAALYGLVGLGVRGVRTLRG